MTFLQINTKTGPVLQRVRPQLLSAAKPPLSFEIHAPADHAVVLCELQCNEDEHLQQHIGEEVALVSTPHPPVAATLLGKCRIGWIVAVSELHLKNSKFLNLQFPSGIQDESK